MKYSTQFKTALLSSVFMLPAVSAADEVSDLFTAITSSYEASIPAEKVQTVYDNFCQKDAQLQSRIDFYILHNNMYKEYVQKIPEMMGENTNDTTYASQSYSMPARSFPFPNWIYNSITWAGEPMKFYYLIRNSWAAAPIYNISPDRNTNPTGRLVMNIAIGDHYDLPGTDYEPYSTASLTDNFNTDRLAGINPYRKIMMITREPDGNCDYTVYMNERVDPQYSANGPVTRNEIRFFAPHGNFRFEIMDKDWDNPQQKIQGSFTHDLNTLTIDGVKYRMIPANRPWNMSTWYLKGNGPLHEKWLYMYPVGDIDNVYVDSSNPKYHKANKVVVLLFDKSTRAGVENETRYVLYPKKK